MADNLWQRQSWWVFFTLLAVSWMKTCGGINEYPVPMPQALSMFNRYGYLPISIRTVPRNDSESWLFREPTVAVFEQPKVEYNRSSSGNRRRTVVFDGHFHMEFCDDVDQLLQAYFRDFLVERMDSPWRAYTASWNRLSIAKQFGINSSYVTPDHSYILVRVARRRLSGRVILNLSNGLNLTKVAAEAVNDFHPGSTKDAIDFFSKIGSHYIHSFVSGNALYQVFVYNQQVYNRIKSRLKTKGVGDLTNFELYSYFSPWYAEHIGRIQVASGNTTVSKMAAKKLRVNYYFFNYSSLLRLHGDPTLLSLVDSQLTNEAVLELELRTLAPLFSDPEKRRWYETILDNIIKLWEANM